MWPWLITTISNQKKLRQCVSDSINSRYFFFFFQLHWLIHILCCTSALQPIPQNREGNFETLPNYIVVKLLGGCQVIEHFSSYFVPFFPQTQLKVCNCAGLSWHLSFENPLESLLGTGRDGSQASPLLALFPQQCLLLCAERGFAFFQWCPWKRYCLAASVAQISLCLSVFHCCLTAADPWLLHLLLKSAVCEVFSGICKYTYVW